MKEIFENAKHKCKERGEKYSFSKIKTKILASKMNLLTKSPNTSECHQCNRFMYLDRAK